MNSEKMVQNYANSNEIKYGAHYIILASDKVTFENPVGKFIMTYANPDLSGEAFDFTLPKNNSGNVINKVNLGIDRVTTSNYIELKVPEYFFTITDINIRGCESSDPERRSPSIFLKRKEYYKGQKFIVVNAGGEVDTPCIIGVV